MTALGAGGFGDQLAAAIASQGPVCVGLDPHPQLLQRWGVSADGDGLRAFGRMVVERVAGSVAAIKPQSAFFEEYGSAGIAALEDILAAARDAGVLSVLDVKRGDIGSTMAGYARAYLAEQSPLRADAITLSPYLGYESLRPALDLAHETGRGVFVLALTSNPEARELQREVAGEIVAAAAAENAARPGRTLGSVGLVVGATIGSVAEDLGIDLAAVGGPMLAPGVGAQGAGAAEIAAVFGNAGPAVLAASSRGLLQAGPEGLAAAAAELTSALRSQT